MEPPVKRRRLGESLHGSGDEEQFEDEEWEEYDGDNDTGDAPQEHREGSVAQDDGYQLAIEKAYADNRFRATMSRIFEKYGRDFEGIGDEIDLSTGQIVVNNGHIENMRNEVDIGIPHNGGDADADEDDDEDGDEDEDGVGEDDGLLLEDLTDNEAGEAHSLELLDDNNDDAESADEAHPWVSDTEYDRPPDYMKLQGPYPDPETLDLIPGYSHREMAEEGPSLISGLYDGGGLRYAQPLGSFGTSPFALGPWEMLHQVEETYETPKQDGLSSMWTSDYRFKDNQSDQRPSAMAQLGLAGGSRPRANKLKGLPSTEIRDAENVRMEDYAGESANLFEQHPEKASAFSVEYDQQYESGTAGSGHAPQSTAHKGKTPAGLATEDSDTVEDSVFSVEEIEASSQTGDESCKQKSGQIAEPSNRVIPDSQDTCPSQENDTIQPSTETARVSAHKPSQRDFDLACMLSDDESPLFTLPVDATNHSHHGKSHGQSSKPRTVGIPEVDSDGSAVRRGRGRPRKHPRPDTYGQKLPAAAAKKTKPPHTQTPNLNLLTSSATVGNGNAPWHNEGPWPNLLSIGPPTSTTASRAEPVSWKTQLSARPIPSGNIPSTTTAASRPEAAPGHGVKRKRGRPRKYPLPEPTQQHAHQSANSPSQQQPMQYPAHQMFGHPYFYSPFQQAFQPQLYQHPFQALMQQPVFQQPMLPFAQQFAYQSLQNPFFQQPVVQFQPHISHQRVQQQNTQQTTQPNPPAPEPEGAPQQPVKRKRGRPRKYPVGYKRSRRKVHMPGLQNSMTAILSGHPNRTPVSEDAWYGVARRLAQDISSLQGGYMFSNGFQIQTQPYPPSRKQPRTSPKKQFVADSSESESESEDEDELDPYETTRITEVLESNNEEASPVQTITQTVQTDNDESADILDISMSNDGDGGDDAGFTIIESPGDVAKTVQPTPSPPSPPTSIRGSSPVSTKGRQSVTPTPVRTTSSRTPTPLQSLKPPTPISHKSDEFDLPSSPVPPKEHIYTSAESTRGLDEGCQEPIVEMRIVAGLSQDTTEAQLQDHEDLPKPTGFATQIPDKTQDPPEQKESTEQRREPLQEASTASLTVPVAPMELSTAASSSAGSPSPTKSKTAPIVISQQLPDERSSTSSTDRTDMIIPDQPKVSRSFTPDLESRCPSPSLFVSSPARTRPQTPDEPEPNTTVVNAPQEPLAIRSPMVPRSADRCTPVFVDTLRSKLPIVKEPIVKEKRTMREIKAAIIAPRYKAPEPKPTPLNPPVLKSTSTKPILGRSIEKDAPVEPSASSERKTPKSPVKESLWPGTSKPSTMSSSHQSSVVKDKKRSKSRRSLISLISGDASNKEVGDDLDELSSPVTSKSSSSKPTQPFDSSKIARDTTRNIWKSSPQTTDEPKKSGREKKEEKEKEKKSKKKKEKKRRHIDGYTSRNAASAASEGGIDKECGVGGYTCNRDFCFTCL
ncbi:hypothetical protein QQS21_007480 [Conoideocrella luteorostrata]|uniref:Myb-like DNA-binding domain protein n=1 Tax=Conoideocrella luteorostrata TaxID=1105319 RepID=A0AAJ0FXB9_9HYPO|nr:hypothetical protein QQS21_007480 [Conoideocrella luteorostrata]